MSPLKEQRLSSRVSRWHRAWSLAAQRALEIRIYHVYTATAEDLIFADAEVPHSESDQSLLLPDTTSELALAAKPARQHPANLLNVSGFIDHCSSPVSA